MAYNTKRVLLTAMLLVTFTAAVATEYIVGNEHGWTRPDAANGVDYTLWANSSNFMVGDSLVFNYEPSFHNVLAVNGAAFAACNSSDPLAKYTDGNTTISFYTAGRYWFICGTRNHCSAGQALKVSVAASNLLDPAAVLPTPAQESESGAGNSLVKSSKSVVVLLVVLISTFV